MHLSGKSFRVKLQRVARKNQGRHLGRNTSPLPSATRQRGLVGRPVVQRGWIKISPVWPYECAHLGINTHLIEQCLIPQRSEQFSGEHRSEINHLFCMVLKLDAQGIRADNLDSLNMMNRVVHTRFL